MAFTNVTLTRTYSNFSGLATGGTVSFCLSNPMLNGTAMQPMQAIPTTVDGSGVMAPVTLAANDDPGTTPEGIVYQVTEQITYPSGPVPAAYYIVVPHLATGGTADLAQLKHYSGQPSPPAVQVNQVGQPDGVASLDSSGHVPASQIPGSAGVTAIDGGSASSVFGGTTGIDGGGA